MTNSNYVCNGAAGLIRRGDPRYYHYHYLYYHHDRYHYYYNLFSNIIVIIIIIIIIDIIIILIIIIIIIFISLSLLSLVLLSLSSLLSLVYWGGQALYAAVIREKRSGARGSSFGQLSGWQAGRATTRIKIQCFV